MWYVVVVNVVCFVAGIAGLVSADNIPAWPVLIVLCLLAIVVAGKYPPLFCLLAGFVYASLFAGYILSKRLPEELLNTEVIAQGTVSGLPAHNGTRLRFLFKLESVASSALAHEYDARGAIVRLNWYRDAPQITPGQQLQLLVKLRTPSGFMNPGGFDYEKWLFQQRIAATGYVRSKSGDFVVLRETGSWLYTRRAWLSNRITQATNGLTYQSVILALAVGDRSGIDSQLWDRFIATGTNHLLAISGLHISLVAGCIGLIARFVWRYMTNRVVFSRTAWSLVWAAMAAFCYAAMAGFSVPTQRAMVMFFVLSCLVLLRRHQARQGALAVALLVVCVLNPLAVMSAGFWMSFAAVAILFVVFSFTPQPGVRARAISVIRGHTLITIGLYPLTLLVFQQVSLVAPLANFICVPLLGMVATPLVFLSSMLVVLSVDAAAVVFQLVDKLLAVAVWLIDQFSLLPAAMLHTGSLPAVVILIAIVAAGLLLLPVKPGLRWLAAVLTVPFIFVAPNAPDPGDYEVTFLDVGQGTAVVVRTANHTLLYDTGAQFSATFSAADSVILPFFKASRIDRLDQLMISHADRDHSGGVEEVLASMDVVAARVSAPLPQLPQAKLCRAGEQWLWDDVKFQILHPRDKHTGSENDLSCVLLISSSGERHTLLTGDIEAYGEQRLLESGIPSVELLLVPHHGSNTSSTSGFVSLASPRYAVHTTGFNNRFGFPKEKVVERYQLIGAQQYSTANSGAITFNISDQSDTRVRQYRLGHSGFWARQVDDVFPEPATLNAVGGKLP